MQQCEAEHQFDPNVSGCGCGGSGLGSIAPALPVAMLPTVANRVTAPIARQWESCEPAGDPPMVAPGGIPRGDGGVCWYHVRYYEDTGEIISVELLFCEG